MSALAGKALILVENLSVPFDRRVWQECHPLRDAGWEVHVICPQGTKRDTEPYVELDGVRIHRYPLQRGDRRPGRLPQGVRLRALAHAPAGAAGRRAVDVVHACNPPDLLFLVARMLKRQGAKFVFDQHDLVPELYLSRFDRGEDFLYRAVCRAGAADLPGRRRGHRDQRELPAGRASAAAASRRTRCSWCAARPLIERFHQVPAEPELKQGKPYLLCYLGVMGPQDGVDYALRALAKLRDEQGRTDWHAVFVGGGDTFDAMVALAARARARRPRRVHRPDPRRGPGALPVHRRRVPVAGPAATRSTTCRP